MKMLKRLFTLAVLGALAYAVWWTWQSPYFAVWQIDRGLRERDVVRVERYVDLEALVRASAQLTAALASEQLGVNGTDIGSRVLGGIVGAVASGIGDAVAVEGAMELRRAVQEGRVERALGPFRLHDGVAALGLVQRFGQSALLELKGTCKSKDASVRAVFEERDGNAGAILGYPKRWVLVGIDETSLKELARACR